MTVSSWMDPGNPGCSAMFVKCQSMVVLLDLSAAFDIINIDALLRRLDAQFANDTQFNTELHNDNTLFTLISCFRAVPRMVLGKQPEWQILWPALVSINVKCYVLNGTFTKNLCKLQRVLKALVPVVSGTRRSDHITLVLAGLHWLPVTAGISFEIALLTFKAITTEKPKYLTEMLDFQTTSKTLRSSSRNHLHVNVVRTVFASQSFRHTIAAPSVWNNRPTQWSVPNTGFFQKTTWNMFVQYILPSLTALLSAPVI